jgi:hypothetical protein
MDISHILNLKQEYDLKPDRSLIKIK